MISLIEATNYRSLRYISQTLGSFHILVGPNASGKTTFLDVISFLSQFVSNGLDFTLNERTKNFKDLTWRGSTDRFELAIEAKIPDNLQKLFNKENNPYDTIRYEVAIGLDKKSGQVGILEERVLLKVAKVIGPIQKTIFPVSIDFIPSLITKGTRNSLTIVNKVREGNDYFRTEFYKEKKSSWQYAFRLGPQKSALGNLPDDETQFPATTWLRTLLTDGVQPFVLNSLLIRRASPPGQIKGFKPDGSNLPWVIEDLYKKNPSKFREWIYHIQTALPDIADIRTVEREDDHSRYIMLKYQDGLEIPSWVVSDGTLRLLALTLPAYLPELKGIYLIEEPENGIHPRAVETIFQSLSSVYNAQILLASHSPVILGISEPEDVLCFAKTEEGVTDIVAGNLHPALAEWQGETNLGILFASGVLG
jgi:predicted ATPase